MKRKTTTPQHWSYVVALNEYKKQGIVRDPVYIIVCVVPHVGLVVWASELSILIDDLVTFIDKMGIVEIRTW